MGKAHRNTSGGVGVALSERHSATTQGIVAVSRIIVRRKTNGEFIGLLIDEPGGKELECLVVTEGGKFYSGLPLMTIQNTVHAYTMNDEMPKNDLATFMNFVSMYGDPIVDIPKHGWTEAAKRREQKRHEALWKINGAPF